MALTRTFGPSSKLNTAALALLLLIVVSPARGLPLNGQALDSAVEGVQKYLESSGFPKMTRGEILDFLNDFSRNSRVSRSEKTTGAKAVAVAAADGIASTSSRPSEIPRDESPLNYGYPMSSNKRSRESTTPTIFVTVEQLQSTGGVGDGKKKKSGGDESSQRATKAVGGVKGAQKNRAIGPSVDLNAYAEFKKIPEARNVKIDDDMKSFLNDFGLLDAPKSGRSIAPPPPPPPPPQRRNDDGKAIAVTTESADEKLLETVLRQTGNVDDASASGVADRASSARDLHVFNPSSSNVKTVDVNRIAKIVENIRLLTDDDNLTASSLSHDDAFQKKLENITAAIGAIDQPTAAGGRPFDGYEVFFDDDSKETDSDLPESPAAAAAAAGSAAGTEPLNEAQNPPDPLSTDELQQLVEKNKSDVKRQQPAGNDTDAAITVTASAAEPTVSASPVTAASASEGTSVETTSSGGGGGGGGESRDSSTTAATADANPSLSQLAESFGGGDTASDSPPVDAAPDAAAGAPASPNRPKNGLYFYVDWNSFLTVNEGQKNQVNLRFAPKAGNPAHFFKITVP